MGRPRTLSDDVILDRATHVFWRRGYAGTSLRDLTRATGLSTAALYNRYADKDGLFVEVLQRYADGRLVERVERLSAGLAPLDAIRTYFDELVALSLSDPEQRGCLRVNTALDGAATSPAARALVRDRLGRVETFFAAQLRRALARGEIAANTDIPTAAAAMAGTTFGLRVLARLDPDPARLRAMALHGLSLLRAPPP